VSNPSFKFTCNSAAQGLAERHLISSLGAIILTNQYLKSRTNKHNVQVIELSSGKALGSKIAGYFKNKGFAGN